MAQDGGATAKSAPPSMLATCRRCGDVVIRVDRSQVLRIGPTGAGWYSFDCPMCGDGVRESAPEHLLSLLACLGARCVELETRTASPAPARQPATGALTLDDLVALTTALASTHDLVAHALTD